MNEKKTNKNMTIEELYLLTHPDKWPYEEQLPLVRRGGNPVYCLDDTGIVTSDNLCRVWMNVLLGRDSPLHGIPLNYKTPEELLKQWAID
jgi:hypothetical protein